MRILLTLVVLLSSAGLASGQAVLDWAWYYQHPAGLIETMSDMKQDPFGNIVVVGYGHQTEDPLSDVIIVFKMTPAGDTAWLRTYDADSAVTAQAVDIDALGNIYISGYIIAPWNGMFHPLVLKYYPDGTLAWDYYRFTNDVASYYGRALDIAVDDNNEVYFTAEAWDNTGGGFDMLTAKLRADGTLAWESYYNHDDYNPQADAGVVIKYRDGFIYTAGRAKDTLASLSMSYDLVLAKHDTAGTLQWTTEYVAEREFGDDGPCDMTIDVFGNVYVAGYVSSMLGNGWNHDYALIKFDGAGAFQWDYIYGSGNYYEEARSVVIDHDNNVIATGVIEYSLEADFYTVKLSPDGTPLWISRIFHGTDKTDIAYDVVVDKFNNLYIGGASDVSNVAANLKMQVTRLDPDGNIDWSVVHSGISPEADYIYHLALDGDSVLYAGGPFIRTAEPLDCDMAVVRWRLPGCCDLRGDVDGSDAINVSDLTYLVAYLFRGGPNPLCEDEADVDGSTTLNVSDLTYLVSFLFKGGTSPVPCG